MDPIEAIYDTEEYRDHIATVDEHGKRIWIYPKKPKGRFTNMRTVLSGILLAFLFGMPFIKFNGEPFLLFNIIERKFILFGIVFMPQDFHLFGLAMLTLLVFIVLFTVVFGRLFCGWVCPQTIFMEMVFRKIEYWIEGDSSAQRKLNAAPWTSEKIIKKTGKLAVFFLIAVLVSNTFLAYILGIDEVIKIATEPVSQHLGGFIAMILFSFAFFFVFAYLREQVCVAICPYGRLQGVLLDHNSIVITYDHVRGEPRGKIKKEKKTAGSPVSDIAASVTQAAADAKPLGDCIDCKLCVHVCPTGIDIRNGTQLECVNCTACIDACDEVMDKVSRPRGLIRYDSHNGIIEKRRRIFTPRVIAYTIFLAILLGLNFA
ncbi:MAG: cytochrome c oxidase accessory protein CcoG, partial [Saprospiraceae bacterium]|nr:cytochrome c oxidase accessory protein CcoG [Saprospiraceae bacterium]